MKKLITMVATLATGLAAWTGLAAGGLFSNSWNGSGKTAADWNSDGLWTGSAVSDQTKVSFDAEAKALKLSTGDDSVLRAVNSEASLAVSDRFYFDVTLSTRGEALDAVPDVDAADRLSLFWLDAEDLSSELGKAQAILQGTNLCAIAKDPSANRMMLLVYSKSQTASICNAGSNRLSIEAYANVLKEGSRAGFLLYAAGTPVEIAYVVPYTDAGAPDWDSIASADDYLANMLVARLELNRRCVALSLTEGSDLKGMGFTGNADIASVSMQEAKPEGVPESSIGATMDIGGVVTRFTTLADALAAIGDATSAAITLVDDASADGLAVREGLALTIDLAGKTVTGTFTVSGGLVVKDSSDAKTGRITASAAGATVENATVIAVNASAGLKIEAGIFDGKVSVAEGAGTVSITGGSFKASDNSTASTPAAFALAAYLPDGKAAALDGDYYVLVSAVAKIGNVGYATLQAALDAAEDGATVVIAKDCTFEDATILNPTEYKAITIQNDYVVSFVTGDTYSFQIDNASVTFTGTGTWKKEAGSASMIRGGATTASAIVVNGGTFIGGIDGDTSAKHPSNVMTAKSGTITVNGGTFFNYRQTEGRCVRAEQISADVKATATINGGTFTVFNAKGQEATASRCIPVDDKGGKGTVVIPAASTAKFTGYDANIVDIMIPFCADGYTLVKGADGAFAVASEADVVAKIGNASYLTLEAALAAAVAAGEATVTIAKNCTVFETTCRLVGQGVDVTKITLVNDYTVTMATESHGFFVDNLSLTLQGTGTWTKPGSGSMFLAGEKSAAANITVESGNFTVPAASCIFNAQLGVITVNGGTFTTANKGGYCVRAEDSDVDTTAGGAVVINGGTFEALSDGTWAPVSVKKETGTYATISIPTSSTAKFKGNPAKITTTMAGYIANSTEAGAKQYEFAPGDDGFYALAEKAPAIVPIPAGTSKTDYVDDASATAAAAAINADKAAGVVIPNEETLSLSEEQKAAYLALFEAKASGTSVTVDFTADAAANLQKAADDVASAFKLEELAASDGTTGVTLLTITDAKPGLFYTLLSGTETPASLPTATSVQAGADGTVAFSFKKAGDRAFFRLQISAQKVDPPAAE